MSRHEYGTIRDHLNRETLWKLLKHQQLYAEGSEREYRKAREYLQAGNVETAIVFQKMARTSSRHYRKATNAIELCLKELGLWQGNVNYPRGGGIAGTPRAPYGSKKKKKNLGESDDQQQSR